MAGALEAGYALAALALCFVALAMLQHAKAVTEMIVHVFNVPVFGTHPFGGLAQRLENSVIRVLNNAIRDVEKLTAKFESGLIDAFGMLIAIPLLLAFGVKAGFEYLWSSALRPVIHSITNAISTAANSALTKVGALEKTVAGNVTDAAHYADTAAAGALKDAKGYADHWIDNAVKVVNGNISDALAAAHRYADTAVAKLRSAEDTAIAEAVGIANAAKTAGIEAAAGVLRTAEAELGDVKNAALAAAAGALTTAEHYTDAARDAAIAAAGGALATAEQYADALKVITEADAAALAAGALTTSLAAVDSVKSIAIDLGRELGDIERAAGPLGAAALIATIPAIATLTHAIATEAGLEKPDCRSKVKGICGTDPFAWEQLLGGLAALGFAFKLSELHDVAAGLADELAVVIREAA